MWKTLSQHPQVLFGLLLPTHQTYSIPQMHHPCRKPKFQSHMSKLREQWRLLFSRTPFRKHIMHRKLPHCWMNIKKPLHKMHPEFGKRTIPETAMPKFFVILWSRSALANWKPSLISELLIVWWRETDSLQVPSTLFTYYLKKYLNFGPPRVDLPQRSHQTPQNPLH